MCGCREVGVARLDQCLMSPGRRDTGLVCPGPATLSALSRRHSASRHGDDTVTPPSDPELDHTAISPTLLHTIIMELLLRQNTFDIHKPPGGGLFDREYLHLGFFSRRLLLCQLASSRQENFAFNPDHVILMARSVRN